MGVRFAARKLRGSVGALRTRGLVGLLTVVMSFCAQLGANESRASENRDGEHMAILVVDLQAGFTADAVVVLVDGTEVLRREGVSTNFSIGRADSVEVDAAGGRVTVEVRVPTQGISGETTFDVGDTPYVGVSSEDGRIEFRLSKEMFVYF
jgi:hypothetical protein